ncbi:50S ribosomal protein L11 methyltransferase [Pelagibius litoralis]|uniref:Ribosomal protein L11 methyltransferase n=1 Tax=Pelagibius litoralis TaxID=374515 RepID=A0A967C555_9PROT|nr:50S ribosomal protein L11 methyltransferase [Pelagibius litoralis]NIA68655.1 50S ribosomal protein L11 methyltransferase [Pelagibius litoralis]
MTATYCLTLALPEPSLTAFEAVFEPLGGALVTGGKDAAGLIPWQLYLADPPGPEELDRLLTLGAETAGIETPGHRLEQLPEVDWVAESQRSLPAITAGRFRIRGSHITGPAPWGAIDLLIDANAAFGTGRHETTRGCLLAMQALAKRRSVEKVLDMGCGSGVLAMAAARLWPCSVLGVDNDAPSLVVTRENLRSNGVSDRVTVMLSDGFRRAEIRARGPYDLILANILAAPLCAMAQDLRCHLAPGGVVVLSGLLVSQEQPVIARYRAAGLRLVTRYRLAEWSTLVLAG